MQRIRSRAAGFAAALPAIAAALDAAPLANAIRGASLAARLNAFLPSAVWKKPTPDAKAFYDPAQPRDNIGRWTNGGGFSIPSKTLSKIPVRAKDVYEMYQKRGGRPLAHDGLPTSAKVSMASIEHCHTVVDRKLKSFFFANPRKLQEIFKRGYMREETVRLKKNGVLDHNKTDWSRCWHIRGKVRVNSLMHHYDFTVFQRKSNGETVLYDFAIR